MNIKLVIFDVNQTMFSLSEIEKAFQTNNLNKELVEVWFNAILKEGFSYSLSGKFIDFYTIAINELKKLFLLNKRSYKKKLATDIMKEFANLKVHPDITKSLVLLKKKKKKVVTLTNGSHINTVNLLKKNKIENYIDSCFSIDQLKLWKPHKKVYLNTCKTMGIKSENTLMIAAHGWDINGAKLAGLKTAFISRYEKVLSDFYSAPNFSADNILDVVKELE